MRPNAEFWKEGWRRWYVGLDTPEGRLVMFARGFYEAEAMAEVINDTYEVGYADGEVSMLRRSN